MLDDQDFDDFTIGGLLAQSVERFPDREALVCRDRRWPYAELDRRANNVSTRLLALGLQPGDKVAINIPNWIEFVCSFVAAVRMGAVAVPLSTRYREHEIRHILTNSQARVLVTVSEFNDFDYLSMIDRIRPDLPDLKHVIALGAGDQPPLLNLTSIMNEDAAEQPTLPAVSGYDTAAILYTSGTTGAPKGVMLSHANLVGNALSVSSEVLNIASQDTLLLFIPLSHSGGITTLLWAFATGARTVLLDIFHPEETLELIAREKVSVVHGVPTAWIKMAAEAQAFDLSALRLGIMGAAPCPAEAVREVNRAIPGCDLRIAYGMTESAPLSCVTCNGDRTERRVDSVGRALPGVEVRVVDDENGQELPPGQIGEVVCRGYNVMQGYFAAPELTAQAIDPDGWLHTGDLGAIDEEGYVRIVGRKKEMIIRGGFKIYPREVEEFLFTHPGIQNAAVVGIPEAVYGESVWAFVVPKDGTELNPDEIIEFCHARIANFKVPRVVRIVDDLPMTGSGKVKKFQLREMAGVS